MKQFDDNDCKNCGGTGSEPSGVEYMGAHEMVGCEWCAGTGFDDIYLGVERLRTEVAEANKRINQAREWLLDRTDDQMNYQLNRELDLILQGEY